MLVGKKVNLRRIEKVDLWQLWQWHEKQELYLFRQLDLPISWDNLNENFMKYFAWKGDFLVEDMQGKGCGVCSYQQINWKNRNCELALQFYGAEQESSVDAARILLSFLFNEMNLLRIYLFMPIFFTFEIQAIEKVGLVLEGRLREVIFHNGGYKDTLVYGILKEEFRKERV